MVLNKQTALYGIMFFLLLHLLSHNLPIKVIRILIHSVLVLPDLTKQLPGDFLKMLNDMTLPSKSGFPFGLI